jgi:hypothetical protein
MGFSELEKQRIKKIVGGFCENRIPDYLRDQINLFHKIRGNDVSIIESRPHFIKKDERTESSIERMSFDSESMKWQLFWEEGKWPMAKIYPFKTNKKSPSNKGGIES